jgi:hypothetical protein
MRVFRLEDSFSGMWCEWTTALQANKLLYRQSPAFRHWTMGLHFSLLTRRRVEEPITKTYLYVGSDFVIRNLQVRSLRNPRVNYSTESIRVIEKCKSSSLAAPARRHKLLFLRKGLYRHCDDSSHVVERTLVVWGLPHDLFCFSSA